MLKYPLTEGSEGLCLFENEHGACIGVHVCRGDDGWSPCRLADGVTEACNGRDDDCDGETDERFFGLGEPCDGPQTGG